MKSQEARSPEAVIRFGELTGKYGVLVSFFRHRLPTYSPADVEDLVQETLLAAWCALSGQARAVPVRDPVQFMLRIARNKSNDLLRKSYRAAELPLDQRDLIDRFSSVAQEHRILEQDLKKALVRSLSRLPRFERSVLYLRFFEELDNRGAAARLGMAPEECSRIRYRALKRLRDLLGSKLGENGRY